MQTLAQQQQQIPLSFVNLNSSLESAHNIQKLKLTRPSLNQLTQVVAGAHDFSA
jgi:hypothetical protein